MNEWIKIVQCTPVQEKPEHILSRTASRPRLFCSFINDYDVQIGLARRPRVTVSRLGIQLVKS
jgi:hypothetical protein